MTKSLQREPYPMLDIAIKGRIREKRRINTFVKSVMAYLSPRLRRDISIELNVINKCDGDAYALCWGDKNEVIIELARSSRGHKFTLDEMMLNLAHELVHAKQFITGQLSPVRMKWKTIDHAKTPYSRQPWELEAYRKEEKLYKIFWE